MKVTVTLSRGDNAREPIAVVVSAHFVRGVFAVHKLDRTWQPWELVHIPTGLRLGVHETLREAKRIAVALPQLGQRCTLHDTTGFERGQLAALSEAYRHECKVNL